MSQLLKMLRLAWLVVALVTAWANLSGRSSARDQTI